ncbi:MAG: glycosyltransferase [Bacteroidales bacterium]|nr:glycosyltransferase [Bacteroidales bacterium]
MKVLQLGKFYPIRGGVEKVMWDLTGGLSARGIDCDMLCAELEKDEIIHLNGHGRVICLKAWRKMAATMIAPKMVSWLRKHKGEYNIIHVHHPDPMACLALRLSGYKGRVILHWHSDILKQKTLLRFYAPLQRWLIRRADTIVGTTPVYLKESPYLKDVQDKTVALPIGIKPVTFNERIAAEWKERYPGRKLVVSIGRLVPYKGYGYLVAAAKHLGPDYQVLIVGDGPVRENLEEDIRINGVDGNVKLLGYVEDEEMHALLAACDVFVLSSIMKTEAFGIVQIEAMSLGKPVVATKVPESGVSWVNADGESGLNVPIKDSEALAKAIRTICTDASLHEKFSKGALERFDRLFTLEGMIDKTIKIYNDEKND